MHSELLELALQAHCVRVVDNDCTEVLCSVESMSELLDFVTCFEVPLLVVISVFLVFISLLASPLLHTHLGDCVVFKLSEVHNEFLRGVL